MPIKINNDNNDPAPVTRSRPSSQPSKSIPSVEEVGDRSSRFGVVKPLKRRLITVASGLQKRGKDHWGFTAPGPIAIHAFEPGYDEAANKFRAQGKLIKPVEYEIPEVTSKRRDESLERIASEIWDGEFVPNYIWSLKNFRSVLVSTSTEMWELIRIARLGAHSTGQKTSFGPINAEFRKLIREAYNHDANVIFLQKLGKKYINGEWTGDYEPRGFGDMAFEAQLVVQLWREDPNIFHTTVLDCRQEPRLNGEDFTDPINDFPAIASNIFNGDPFSGRSDWE